MAPERRKRKRKEEGIGMEIERILVGSLIKSPSLIPEVYEVLKHSDFENNNAAIVYSFLIDMVKSEEEIDLITVSKKCFGKIDLGWLSECCDMSISQAATTRHAKIISDTGRAKRLTVKLKNLAVKIDNPDEALHELLNIYSSEMTGDNKSCHISDVAKRFRELIFKNSNSQYGIETGYDFLSSKFIRYMPGHIWIIGAWTSVGKTATMVDMLCRVLTICDPTIAIISTEMMEEQNVARFLANQTGFHSQEMLSGRLHGSKQKEMDDSLKWFSERNIYLYDNVYSLQDIEMKLRQLNMKRQIDIVFIDYIQNMTFNGASSEYESKSEIAKGLQRLAKQLKTCIVCLSQIPTSAIKDDSDILEYKGAGEIAAVADLGIRLKSNPKEKGFIKFIIGKNRHGRTGQQMLQFVNNYTRLMEVHDSGNE